MRRILLALAVTGLAMPTLEAPASARTHYYQGKVWRDSKGRLRCHRSNGTTGLIVGAAGGALVGRAIDTHGERATERSSARSAARWSAARSSASG